MNKVILKGRLTKEPESSSTQSGVLVTKFSIAVDRRFKKEGQPEADFINCVSFNHTAEFVQKYFKKGQEILVCGSIQTRSWDDNEGNKRWATEVIVDEVNFCGPKKDAPINVAPEDAEDVLTELKNSSRGFMPVDNDDNVPW
jgi:single-strand DNA-binding protein